MSTTPSDGTNKVTEKIKGFLNSKFGEFIIFAALSALTLLFTVIYLSVHFTDLSIDIGEVARSEQNFWSAGVLNLEKLRIVGFNIFFIVAFAVQVLLYVVALIVVLLKKEKRVFYAAAAFSLILALVCIILGLILGLLRSGAVVCGIIAVAFSITTWVFAAVRRRATRDKKKLDGNSDENTVATSTEQTPPIPAKLKKFKVGMLVCSIAALVIMFSTFFVPTHFEYSGATARPYILIGALSADYPIYMSIAFVIMFVVFFSALLYFVSTVVEFVRSADAFAVKSKNFMTAATAFDLVFFVLGFSLAFYVNLSSGDGGAKNAFTVSYIPLILATATLIVYSIFCGKLNVVNIAFRPKKALKIEPLIWIIAMTALTFLSLIFKIVVIQGSAVGFTFQDISLSGYELLSRYKTLESGFQALAFIEVAFLLVSGVLFALTLISFLVKSKGYYKTVKTAAITNFMFVLILGLFGLYFKIVQAINVENIKSVLESAGQSLPEDFTYEVSSQTIFMLIASFAVIVAMMFRGIFNLGVEKQPADDRTLDETPASASRPVSEPVSQPADVCPAFTELDGKQPEYRAALEERRNHLFGNPTLPDIVRFVVDYARECRLHLSYSPEDMATFVAGLGASRLAILQGMSGTGKTSLPKVFTEALMGNCEIVEVESSWRDKHELLGYYNEFSKCFTPKKFTQCLYKARLNPSVLTFIVLDEMNLSRIEYYFSDFLSLMENEEDKREIKLLNVKLFRIENGEKIAYDGLVDGHTIKIPANVWFIGTANRDESTFEISDKVYDRAQTMNFNKRAPKIHSFGTPLDRKFLAYETLVELFDKAKAEYAFEAEDCVLVQKTEKLLAPYNISFGNRILRQMEDFVKIYCTCFGDKSAVENDAVEKILLSKVVSKLETKVVENKETLAAEFDKLNLKACGEFIRKLNED